MTWLVPLMLMILCVAGSSWDNSKGSIIGSLPGSWLPFSRSSRTRKLSLASRMTDRECSVVTGRHPSTMLRSPCCLESESTLSTRVRGTWVSQSVNLARYYVLHIKLCLYTFEHNALSSDFLQMEHFRKVVASLTWFAKRGLTSMRSRLGSGCWRDLMLVFGSLVCWPISAAWEVKRSKKIWKRRNSQNSTCRLIPCSVTALIVSRFMPCASISSSFTVPFGLRMITTLGSES